MKKQPSLYVHLHLNEQAAPLVSTSRDRATAYRRLHCCPRPSPLRSSTTVRGLWFVFCARAIRDLRVPSYHIAAAAGSSCLVFLGSSSSHEHREASSAATPINRTSTHTLHLLAAPPGVLFVKVVKGGQSKREYGCIGRVSPEAFCCRAVVERRRRLSSLMALPPPALRDDHAAL